MSDDLLFSVIPRQGRAVIKPDDRVKQVSAEARTEALSQQEKEVHDNERKVSEREQYKRIEENLPHRRQDKQKKGDHPPESEKENNKEKDAQKAADETPSGDKKHRLDIYV
ncbi:hypothetical protein OPS25_07585 [Alteromonas ponticola]|uniref:Uncharacterized protein n=1 Tax=Alteromonas aquimaris TaxID=2998417 RepID=A0ABT3P6F6_9ALTE|nr:hypothetical protein [Alteromonas aquimaris]MCW8108353.1 hypothetical protein [Alteromonas aquimaris]